MDYYIILLVAIIFVFVLAFKQQQEYFDNGVVLTVMGACKKQDNKGNCIEKDPLTGIPGIELEVIKEKISNATKIMDDFKSNATEAINKFNTDTADKMKNCFGTKDTKVCETFNDPTCKTYGPKPCIRQGGCSSYHRIPYGCNWGCTRSESYCSRRNWRGSCTGRSSRCTRYGHRSTCYKNGACKSYSCAEYGAAPCTSWNAPTCKSYYKNATFNC